jgi:ribosomal protein RSM22 (predicted rRNA methylase)
VDARGVEDSRRALRLVVAGTASGAARGPAAARGRTIELTARITQLCEGVPGALLARACDEVSAAYRVGGISGGRPAAAWTRHHYLAYLVARVPATSMAIAAAVAAAHDACPSFEPTSVADLGAGPGTSVLALADRYPGARFRLYERDSQFIALARQVLAGVPNHIEFVTADLARSPVVEPADLVLLSYALSELPESAAAALVARAWAAARQMLIVVEPGSPRGFRGVLDVRDSLHARGGLVAAPCPHASACPLAMDDWCHFAARVSRSQMHRRIKHGALSYEDEKFAYVAVAKLPVQPAAARIVRRPVVRPRAVELLCCTSEGLARPTIGRGDRERYRSARAASWGDAWRLGLTRAGKDPSVGQPEVDQARQSDRGQVADHERASPPDEQDGDRWREPE